MYYFPHVWRCVENAEGTGEVAMRMVGGQVQCYATDGKDCTWVIKGTFSGLFSCFNLFCFVLICFVMCCFVSLYFVCFVLSLFCFGLGVCFLSKLFLRSAF